MLLTGLISHRTLRENEHGLKTFPDPVRGAIPLLKFRYRLTTTVEIIKPIDRNRKARNRKARRGRESFMLREILEQLSSVESIGNNRAAG